MHKNNTRIGRVAVCAAILGFASMGTPSLAAGAFAAPAWGDPVLAPDGAVPTDAEAAAGKALRRGKSVPDVSFKNAEGEAVSLESLLVDGPVVLIFYRGGWCPYCVKQLKAFEGERNAIEAAGGRVIAVSPELPEFVGTTRTKNKLGFEVLSDPNAVASRAFGVAWANARYGRGLAKYHGNEKGEIPLGVTYVIDTDGAITWAFLEHDYKKRATPEQAVEALNAIE